VNSDGADDGTDLEVGPLSNLWTSGLAFIFNSTALASVIAEPCNLWDLCSRFLVWSGSNACWLAEMWLCSLHQQNLSARLGEL